MANDLNLCQFIGKLGKDPEVKYTASGDAVANFSIACGESWKDKASGDKKETTEWVRCVAWRKLGEICGEYLTKGSQVYVSGKMKTRKWQDKDGHDRYSTEIQVENMQMLGGKPSSAPATAQKPEAKTPAKAGGGSMDELDDDIPFVSCSLAVDATWKKLKCQQK